MSPCMARIVWTAIAIRCIADVCSTYTGDSQSCVQGFAPNRAQSTKTTLHRDTQQRQQQQRLHSYGRPTRSNALFLAPQQLGEFEPLAVDGQSELQRPSQRLVRLVDLSGQDPIDFDRAWDLQKAVLQRHIERLNRSMLHPQRNVSIHKGSDGDVDNDASSHPDCSISDSTRVGYRSQSSQFLPTGHNAVGQHSDFPTASSALAPDNDFLGTCATGHDTIIMLQHNPVYTLGTGSDDRFVKSLASTSSASSADGPSVPIVRMDRGGEVTYHGPGQLTVYPILDLREYRQDIHWYMRALEEAVLIALKNVGVEGAERQRDTTGIWIDNHKVAAVGIKCKRWVTMHGVAVNVETKSLANFDGIVPCGLEGRKVGCVNQFLPHPITPNEFAGYLRHALEHVFRIELVHAATHSKSQPVTADRPTSPNIDND